MACELETLQSEACENQFVWLSKKRLLTLAAQLICNGAPTPPPVGDNFRIWDTGANIRISNIGDSRIWQ